MKKKKKNYLIAFIAMLLLIHTSSWGRTYDGERTVTTSGNIDLTSWITPVGKRADYLLKIPLEWVDPQLVKTGVGAWSDVYRELPVGYPTGYNYAQWVPSLLPGLYFIDGGAKGKVVYDISYISDPWIGVDQQATESSPHLFSFGGTITAQNSVSLKLSNLWANPGYTKAVVKVENGTFIPIGEMLLEYTIPASSGSGQYLLSTRSGPESPVENYYFNIVFTTSTVPVSGVSLSSTSLTATLGNSPATLTATLQPSNATNKAVSWESNTTSVATVSNGVVSFVGVGNAEITVRTQDGGFTATCAVQVNAATVAVNGVSLSKNASTLTVGATETLVATVSPPNATNKSVSWSSDKTEVASVDQNGKITAHQAGNATITVKTVEGNFTATCNVVVQNPEPTTWTVSFTVNVADAQILLGERTQAGNYTFDNVAAGTYAYTVSKDGYQTVSGTVEVVDQDIIIQITLIEQQALPKSPVFKGLLGEYSAGSAPIELKVVGEGIEGLTFTYKVNGIPATVFTPTTGEHLIEAISNEVELRTKVKVK